MADFNKFIYSIQRAEGGYQKMPEDKGNYNSRHELVGTNHGVAAFVYEDFIGHPPSEAEMRAITKQEALQIFKKNYWDKLKADYINSQAVAETFVDMGINAGVGRAAKLMQRTLKKLGKNIAIDGIVGNQTLAAINSTPEAQLFQAYNQARINYYQNLPTFWKFGRGWLKRIYDLAEKHKDIMLSGGLSIFAILSFFGIGYYLFFYNNEN